MLTTMVEAARRRRRSFRSYQEAIDNFGSKPPMSAFTAEALRNYVEHGFAPSADGVTLRCDPELEAQTFLNGRSNGVWDLLPEITTPVLLVIGEEEEIGPAAMGQDMARRLPNGTFRGYRHLDHMAPFTHPDEMAALVVDAVDAGPSGINQERHTPARTMRACTTCRSACRPPGSRRSRRARWRSGSPASRSCPSRPAST